MKAPIKIGLPFNVRALYIERHQSVSKQQYIGEWGETRDLVYQAGYWLLPISTNPDQTLGVFLQLHDDGSVYRETRREDEMDELICIKERDNV